MHRYAHGSRAHQGSRLHGDLGHAGRRAAVRFRRTAPRTTATGASTSRRSTRTWAPNADFAAFVDCAHTLGLKVYLDVVVNHTADVILLAGRHELPRRRRGAVPRLQGQAVLGSAVRGREALPVPLGRVPAAPAARPPAEPCAQAAGLAQRRDAVPQPRGHRLRSCSPACFEQGDFFGLDDLFTEQPFVVHGLARGVSASWIRRFKVDGFRVDTAKHVDRAFFRVWAPRIRAAARAAGVQRLRDLRRGVRSPTRSSLSIVRPRPRAPERHRLPAPGLARSLRGRLRRSRAASPRGSPTTTTSAGRTASRRRRRRSSGNHDIGRAARLIQRADRARAAPSSCAASILGHSLLYLPARRAGRLLRRRGRDDRARRRQGRAAGHVPDEGRRVAGGGAGRRRRRSGPARPSTSTPRSPRRASISRARRAS